MIQIIDIPLLPPIFDEFSWLADLGGLRKVFSVEQYMD